MKLAVEEIIRDFPPSWLPNSLPEFLRARPLYRGEVLTIGKSREGRPIHGYRIGRGPRRISLIAGAHADEPVGPSTALALTGWLASSDDAIPFLELATFYICPHINPDGAQRNLEWSTKDDYELQDVLEHAVRESPGDDIEFGFPSDPAQRIRPENRAVAEFLGPGGPFTFHASLHGMLIGEGAWFLIDRANVGRTERLRAELGAICGKLGVQRHDWDREGEKGFHRIEPGFCTTPTATAMREYFEMRDEPEEAAKFLWSSMEFIASLGGRPLCMVSEMPLFQVNPSPDDAPRKGHHFLQARDALVEARQALARGDSAPLRRLRRVFGLEPFPRRVAMQLHLAMILLGSGLVGCGDILVESA